MRSPETIATVLELIIDANTVVFLVLLVRHALDGKGRDLAPVLWALAPVGFLVALVGFETSSNHVLSLLLDATEGGDGDMAGLVEGGRRGASLLFWGASHASLLVLLAGIGTYVAGRRRKEAAR